MANTTFANLKIKCLRQAGNEYNANDSTRLEMAGALINDVLSEIQAEIGKDLIYAYDLSNSVNTTSSQAYVQLTDTDIVDILAVYQATDDVKLTQIPWQDYIQLQPDSTLFSGNPYLTYSVAQVLDSGVNKFRLYFIPTPASAIAISYDYLKNIRFSADGTGANSEYCALPTAFDELIVALFRPKYYQIIDPENGQRLTNVLALADRAKQTYYPRLSGRSDMVQTIKPFGYGENYVSRVKATPTP